MARPLPILSLIMLTGSGCQRSSLPGRDPSPGLSASTASATPSPATSPPGASAPPASFASPGLPGRARAPVFFAQAANDYDTRPSLELAKEMDSAGKPHALRIFPARGSTAEEGHAFCSGGMQPEWGDDVLAFFAENGIEGKPQAAAHVPSP